MQEIDGHDPEAIAAAIELAKNDPRPSMIACKTHIALGHAAQDTSKGHGALTDATQLKAAKEAYGAPMGDFEVDPKVKAQWEAMGTSGAATHKDWQSRLETLSGTKQAEFNRTYAGEAPKKLSATIRALKKQISEGRPKVATRKLSLIHI